MKITKYASIIFSLVLLMGCMGYDEDTLPIPQREASTNWIEPELGMLSQEVTVPNEENHVLQSHFSGYDRTKALEYIEKYARHPNHNFAYCANWTKTTPADCTNFVSQVLWYGGVGLNWSGSESNGWWYRSGCTSRGSSKSWRQVDGLLYYLLVESRRGEVKYDPRDLSIGDIIFYRLRRETEGYTCPPRGSYNHSAIVSGFDSRGQPLVSYHSNDVLHTPWSAKGRDLGDLGDACAVVLIHIKD